MSRKLSTDWIKCYRNIFKFSWNDVNEYVPCIKYFMRLKLLIRKHYINSFITNFNRKIKKTQYNIINFSFYYWKTKEKNASKLFQHLMKTFIWINVIDWNALRHFLLKKSHGKQDSPLSDQEFKPSRLKKKKRHPHFLTFIWLPDYIKVHHV